MARIATLAAAAVVGVSGIAFAATAGASAHRTPFLQAQRQLEASLSARQGQLATLTADVKAATHLSATTSATLTSTLAIETANIATLVAKVPNDTTYAQLDADRASMIHNNRVYTVMTPQVSDAIEAANDTASANFLQGAATKLGVEITARKGDRGWRIAWGEFQRMTTYLADTKVDVGAVTPTVLAQTPQGFPGNEGAFVHADRDLLYGEIALARASFDRSVIELFVDGYAAVS